MASAVSFWLLVLSAIMGGLYTTPMTAVKTGWSFEAVWFLYSLLGIVLFPWITGFLTCPDLVQVLSAVSYGELVLTAAFGFGWGIGCQLFGIGISMCGNSLGFALILGLAATLGNVVPLVVLSTDKVATATGAWDFTGLGLAIIALIATAYAGILKERDLEANRLLDAGCAHADRTANKFMTGVTICVLSGILSACLNFANTFGSSIADAAVSHGADETMKLNAIYCISIAAGGIPNLAYTSWKVMSNGDRPWKHGVSAFAKNLSLTAVMGVLWFGSNVAFGAASSMLGDLGATIGFPIYIIGMVVVANVSGIVQGEWKGAGAKAKVCMVVGLALLVLAIGACWLAGSASKDSMTVLAADMLV
eukprot:TRINITY_DN91781_c0_g1_i1.p1 TRINITY_DN91781_c0_g1~~TRINITY_DN91781_c0_g1_i1.p1  ORF type:complete len:363 (-),score=57.50 TRINITY_DN91781_c0_g1_i1:210-1298(-)